jgi:CubicO group peptidase (beta-lactamase class C family)
MCARLVRYRRMNVMRRFPTHGLIPLIVASALTACSAPPSTTQNGPAAPVVGATEVPVPAPAPAPEPVLREGLVVGDPAAEGIDAKALARLVAKATAQHSDALVVVKNGKLVYESYFGQKDEPIYAMSASKSFTSLAYGFLLDEGKLASLDEPIAKTLPAFASDPRKAKVTYRHLLSQTSGLDPRRAGGSKGDIEAHNLSATCMFEPGTSWQYSNNGIDLLAALAGRLAGKPMDRYLNDKLFHPLGIADVDWARDTKGVPLGAGEMLIRPLDMAKVGQAVLDGGKWLSAQAIPPTWPGLSFAQSSTFEPLYGLLWWRVAEVTAVGLTGDVLAQWKTAGLAPAIAAKLAPLVGRELASQKAYQAALAAALEPDVLAALEKVVGAGDHLPFVRNLRIGAVRDFMASGWLGQFLVIAPDQKLVAVRMRHAREADYGGGPEIDSFPSFAWDVAEIAP